MLNFHVSLEPNGLKILVVVWLLIALITGTSIFMGLYIVQLEIRLFFRFLFTQFTWVSDSFMARFPVESNLFFIFWVDNCTDHLNILHLHGLHLRELLNWLVFCIVRHISYRNRIHPLGTLFWVLKASLLPFIARSIFRIIIFIHSKTSSHHKTWL